MRLRFQCILRVALFLSHLRPADHPHLHRPLVLPPTLEDSPGLERRVPEAFLDSLATAVHYTLGLIGDVTPQDENTLFRWREATSLLERKRVRLIFTYAGDPKPRGLLGA